MKIACVMITHLPAKVELKRHNELRGMPVIIAVRSACGALVLDASREAKGVVAGMSLKKALSRCEGATLLEADKRHYHAIFNRIVEALLQRSPLVEKGDLGCAYVGVTGLEPMYDGETGVINALLNAVPYEFNARVGLAKSKFLAYMGAVTSDGVRATKVPEDVRGFLANFPLGLLPISLDNRMRLHKFGLRTIGQVASLPMGPLQAQFGIEGRVAWELANGIGPSWLTAYRQEQTVRESLTFLSPATTFCVVLLALKALLDRAFAHPHIKGKYVRSVSIEAQVMRRAPWTKNFTFRDAVCNKDQALLFIKSGLEKADMPGALEDMSLTLLGITGESGIQLGLFMDVRKRQQLKETMRQLEARLGTRPPVYKIMDMEPWSRLPERRQTLVHFEP